MTSPRFWKDLATTELQDYAVRDSVALLPLAAVEQHGPHLPLSTDLDIGNGLVRRAMDVLEDDFPLLVLPPVSIGDSMEHTSYPGTLSLEPETVIAVIQQTGAAVVRAGVRRLVLFNSHGGNRQVADIAALRLRRDHGMLVVKANYFRFPPAAAGPDADELRHGIHGGALETAMMLHLRPDAVRTERIRPANSLGQALARKNRYLGPEDVASFAWLAEDLNISGVVGDATLATAAMGERLVVHYGGVLADVLRETLAFDMSEFE